MIRVLVGITTAETVCNETIESIYNLIVPQGVDVKLKIVHGYSVSQGRTKLVHFAQEQKFDYLFFVDSDIILPQDTLICLLSSQKLVINGTYPRKEKRTITDENPWTTLYRHDFTDMCKYNYGPFWLSNQELPENGVIPVDCAGLGCTLIHMSVFEILKGVDWFDFCKEDGIIPNGSYCLGEDMNFYRECIRHDIQPFAHGKIRCGHIGKYIYELPPFKKPQVVQKQKK